MSQNQNMLNRILAGKRDFDNIAEKTFRPPNAQELLEYELAQRATKQQLERQGILTGHSDRLASSAVQLEKRLKRRPTLDRLQKQNILQGRYGYMDPEMMR